MASQKEQAEKLKEIGVKLETATNTINKIGTETEGLKSEIVKLNEIITNMGDTASQELIDQVAAVSEKADALGAATKTVDEKVEDATLPPPAEEGGEETPPAPAE